MAKWPTKGPKFAELKQNIDLEQFAASVKGAFLEADDPRQISKIKYPVWFLMLLMLCGYLSGGNTVSDLAIYAELNIESINALIGQTFTAPSNPATEVSTPSYSINRAHPCIKTEFQYQSPILNRQYLLNALCERIGTDNPQKHR